MIPTILTTLAVGLQALSTAGQAFLGTIIASTLFVVGSTITTGHHFIITDSNTTESPAVYLNDETTPVQTWPTTIGNEFCTGNTGALLCRRLVRLTGTGGHRANNAGSWTCSTQSCSIVRVTVMTEATGRDDELYVGATQNPSIASGSQIINYKPTGGSGSQLVATGAYLVPVGWTVKAVYAHSQTLEAPGKVTGAILYEYIKYFIP